MSSYKVKMILKSKLTAALRGGRVGQRDTKMIPRQQEAEMGVMLIICYPQETEGD